AILTVIEDTVVRVACDKTGCLTSDGYKELCDTPPGVANAGYDDNPVCVTGDRLLIFTNYGEYRTRDASGTVVSFHLRDGWTVEGTLPTEYNRLRKILVSGSTVLCNVNFVPQRPGERPRRVPRWQQGNIGERRLVAYEAVSGKWTQLGSTDNIIQLACQMEGDDHLIWQYVPRPSSGTGGPQSGPMVGGVCVNTLDQLMYH
ncbi:hypothetical protein KIPB_007997, partial [Kipferlia bialata]